MDAFSRLLNTMSTSKLPDKKEVRTACTLEAYNLEIHAPELLGNFCVSNFSRDLAPHSCLDQDEFSGHADLHVLLLKKRINLRQSMCLTDRLEVLAMEVMMPGGRLPVLE